MQQHDIPVNPALLRWARDTAGLSLHDATLKAKITPPRPRKGEEPVTAAARLASWEEGRAVPSLSQLEALAKAYSRPLVTFFLPAPPVQAKPLTDYRTVSDIQTESPEFAALKRRIFHLHRELCAIARDEQAEDLTFVGSCTMQKGELVTVDAIRRTLGIELVAERHRSPDDAFRDLRDKAHAAGVYVVLMGDSGNSRNKVSPEEFRGIAIADKQVPLVIINSNDAKAAMHFTLAHELAHIFLGSSGVSNQNAFALQRKHKAIEKFCNAVAAELLVPQHLLRSAVSGQNKDRPNSVKSLARKFSVSDEVIARRLSDLGLLKDEDYTRLIAWCQARWKRNKDKRKDRNGGPPPKIMDRYNFGTKTLETLARATDSGLITLLDAARTLNISVGRFERVVG
ncbi:XRE family transcriptional regulator [Desulfovibrio sp. ZJ369]|uniref:XRE family transcriptional regulator n=1 Tax=Desulfovibrio sp. ZJ369 TaxID=2709793 RepID=UPI001980EDC8|nr:XRE family transcriptional regulator [Desulfovibrio sp. ZJ369]